MSCGFAPHVRHGDAEWFWMRAAFALVIGWTFLGMDWPTEQPHPNGLAHFIDLAVIGAAPVELFARAALVVALALYVAGVALPLATAAAGVLAVWVGTLANSQGAVRHDTQIVALVLLGQCAAHARFAFAGWRVFAPPPGLAARDLAIHYSQQMVAAVYVTAGLTKLIRSRGRWVVDLPDIAVEIVKTHSQKFYDHLEPAGLIERGEHLASIVIAHPNATRAVLSAGLVLELGAFLALRGRLAAFAIGVSLLAMHQGVELLMRLHFRANQALLVIFLVNLPYLAVRGAHWVAVRRGS